MVAPGKLTNPRFTLNQGQEDRSHGQFQDRMGELRWNLSRLKDLGEDCLVQIYDGGTSTGLAFYVQLKSSQDAQSHKPKKGSGFLRYRLEVKDLLHWENSSPLVVLFLWDVGVRQGFWQTIPAIIQELETSNRGWRKKTKVTVSVPLANRTDDDGFLKLRRTVADHVLTPISRTGNTELAFFFPDTEEGLGQMRALEHALDTGEQVSIRRDFISDFRPPEWYCRLYGERDWVPEIIEISPIPSKTSLLLRLEIDSREGPVVIPYLELHAVKQGRKQVTLTNEGQPSLLHVTMVVDREKLSVSLNFKQVRPGSSVYEARDIVAFLLGALNSDRVRLLDLRTGKLIFEHAMAQVSPNCALEEVRLHHELLEKLCFIQQHVARYGTFSLKNGITREDARAADRLFRICRDGKVDEKFSARLRLGPQGIAQLQNEGIVWFAGVQRIKLLNLEIPLGKVRMTVVNPSQFLNEVRNKSARSNGGSRSIRVRDVPVVSEYLEWLPEKSPWDRLYKAGASQAGYFTLSDARAAGYSPEILESLVRDGRVERCAGELFRLVQFPPFEHEDLVLIWLQTHRKAVFSHETALALHELSDILPSKRFIILPPDSEQDGLELGPGVVVHFAHVDESEVSWKGTVPFTSALRTLRDCIDVGVAPDLIEQARMEGIARGLFTDAEAPRIAAAKSA
jgi:hypothetical protein